MSSPTDTEPDASSTAKVDLAEAIITKLDTLTTKVDTLSKTFRRCFTATLIAAPGVLLEYMQVPIVDSELKRAVLGTPGHGESTWTYVKRLDTTPPTFYAMSCAQRAYRFRHRAHEDEEEPQFVVIPKELIEYAKAVLILKDGHCFGHPYEEEYPYEKASHQNITLLKLTRLPDSVVESNVPIWHDQKRELLALPEHHWAFVAGKSLKTPIIGRNAVYDNYSRCLLFLQETRTESGHDGTAMFGFTKNDARAVSLEVEERQNSPSTLLGVYTGMHQVENGQTRGCICLLPAFEAFEHKDLQRYSLEEVWLLTQTEVRCRHNLYFTNSGWRVHQEPSRPDQFGYHLVNVFGSDNSNEGDEEILMEMYGVFIDAPSADEKSRRRIIRNGELEESFKHVDIDH